MLYQGNVCLQHIILDFANGTTVRELLAPSHHFGNCDHQNAFSENRKDESHLVARSHTAREQHFGLEYLEHPPNSTRFALFHLIIRVTSVNLV